MTAIFQMIILLALLLLLVVEELRYRRFSSRVEETRQALRVTADQIKSPLALLRKYQTFLRREEFGRLTLSQQEVLSGVDRAIGDVGIAHDRLLARARIEDGSVDSTKSVSAARAVQAAVNALTPVADAHKQKFVVTGMQTQATVKADPLLLHGILDELLLNAIVYMKPRNSVRISIVVTRGTVSISVKDAGIGIAKSEKPYIFSKFFRGVEARKMASGTGLGLSFVKQFAAEMRGSIRFASVHGKGSTFTLTLPRAA